MKVLLKDILELSKSGLSSEDVRNANELINQGEYGVALELICEQLNEHDSQVSTNLIEKIKTASEKMGLPENTWVHLKDLVE